MSCPSNNPYTFNIVVDNNKLSYRIHINENIDGNQKDLMLSKLNELRWVNPLDDDELNQFINKTIEEPTQCFTGDNTKVINNCYITRTCDSGNKIIDYECTQTIPYNLDDFALETDKGLPISKISKIPNIMPQSSPDFNDNFGYIRCKQGYVFNQLQHNMDTENEYSTAKWVKDEDKLWWVRPDTPTYPTPTNHELSGECVPDKCKEITVPDSSSHSYDPLVGGHLQDPITIECNDGYMFNHDLLHQGGRVKCDYDMIKEGNNIWSPNKMSWYIHDDRLESICNKYISEAECIGGSGYPIPTYNPYDFLNIPKDGKEYLYNLEMEATHDINGVPIGCQWSPPTIQSKGSNTINKPGECKFRKKVNSDTQEKICKPIYCPEKFIPNSDRGNRGSLGPLPGPKIGDIHASCINEDGTIINVNNVRDCMCQKHVSCNTCSTDDNCQWCGSKDSDVEPGCYYKDTNEPICNKDAVRFNAGGACINQYPELDESSERPGWSDMEKTKGNCENEYICRNIYTNSSVPSQIAGDKDNTGLSLEAIRNNYQINTGQTPPEGRGLCESYNNKWSEIIESSGNSNDDICYFNKKYINTQQKYVEGIELPEDFPLYIDNDKYFLSTSPYYCKPTELNDSNAINNCPTHSNYTECAGDSLCSWEENPFSNDIINWSAHSDLNKYRDIIKIKQASPTCYICDNKLTGTSSGANCTPINDATPTKQFVVAYREGDEFNKYISFKTLDNNTIDIDPDVQGKCVIQYLNKSSFSNNNLYNISDVLTNKIHGNYRNYNDAYNCKDGFKFCNPTREAINCGDDGDFISSSSITTNKGNYYCPIRNNCDDKRCFVNEQNSQGDELITNLNKLNEIYDRDNFYSLSGKYTQGRTREFKKQMCNNTFNETLDIYTGKGNYSDTKYSICSLHNDIDSTESLNKQSCDIINKQINDNDTTHWGKFCRGKINQEDIVPMKQVCEKAREENNGSIYEWKSEWSDKDKIWIGQCYNVSTPSIPYLLPDIELCNIASPSNTYEPEIVNKCIITVPSNKDDEIINGICEKWDLDNSDIVSDNIFEYYEKSDDIFKEHNSSRSGHCVVGKGRDLSIQDNLNRLTEDLCENDNNEYLQKYLYDDSSHCDIEDFNYKIDRNLRWTGGELRDNNGNWTGECSAGILSSCPVNCDSLYGGGGNYTCHYNNHSEDVCKHVEDTFKDIEDEKKQKTNCIHHPNCKYEKDNNNIKNSKCKLLVDNGNIIKGQAEWLGNSCYLLNNDAFSHGIYNLSTLDENFPPLIRLIAFFLIIIVFIFLFRKARIYSGVINILISIIEYIGAKILTGTAKVTVDTVKGGKNLVNNINKTGFKLLAKSIKFRFILIVVIALIILYIICYFLFPEFLKNIFTYLKNTFTYSKDYIKKIKQNKKEDKQKINDRRYINIGLLLAFTLVIIVAQFVFPNYSKVSQDVQSALKKVKKKSQKIINKN